MLLKRQIAVDSYENIELGLSQSQELAVSNSRPSLSDDGMNFDRMDVWRTDYPHIRREEPSSGFVDRQRRGALKKRYNMLACHRGKPDEEIIDRVAGLDIVEQSLHGHARAGEHWSSTHDVRRSADDGCAHRGGALRAV